MVSAPSSESQSSAAPAPATNPLPRWALALVGVFGVLLASFPTRNLDLWHHLAAGRRLLHGDGIGPTWLYDGAVYAIYSLGSGTVLVAVKAFLCGLIAVLVLWLSRREAPRWIPLIVTGLAVLTMGSRLLLQPPVLSLLGLVLTLTLLRREETQVPRGVWPGWRFPVLFAIWANVDAWFVLGLVVVALTWLGRLLDVRPTDRLGRALGRWVGAVGVLVIASCLSPSHVNGLRIPPELRSAVAALGPPPGTETTTVNSAFDRTYLTLFWDRPAALAYYPLVALGLFSFLLNRSGWRWAWVLPWLAMAVVSGLQVRLAPHFAVVGGPILAWNLQAFFSRQNTPPVGKRVRILGWGLTILLAAAFLVSAWPGWLQGPPFEPRRWTVETPSALAGGAEFLQRGRESGLFAPNAQTLHLSPDTQAVFAWYGPDDRSVRHDALAGQLLGTAEAQERGRTELRTLGIDRIVLHASEPAAAPLLEFLIGNPEEWPLLHLAGGVVIFGWCDPQQPERSAIFQAKQVDVLRLDAARPQTETASLAATTERPWWEVFRQPAPGRSAQRDEAAVLLLKAAAFQRVAPYRHLIVWDSMQVASLTAAASTWTGPSGLTDAAFRLAILQPPPTEGPQTGPPFARLSVALTQRFWFNQGDMPVGVLYAAIRAARQAVAENPSDANAYLLLGQAYMWLGSHSAERSWGARLSQLDRIRQLQAIAALNRAAELNPKLASAHLELAQLYSKVRALDLSAVHLRTYRDLLANTGGPRKDDRRLEAVNADLTRLEEVVDRQTREFTEESARTSVADRALMAAKRGLVGKARDVLLKSDIAAFGIQGMELELDLLLRTGRPQDVLEWTTPEVESSLGRFSYHWFRVQAFAAAGDAANADAELTALYGPTGRFPNPTNIADILGQMTGTLLLNEQLGGTHLSHLLWRVLSRSDFQNQLQELMQSLGRLSDVVVLRGVLTLESGNIEHARELFRTALTFAPSRTGLEQVEFDGRTVAWECLGLIEQSTTRRK